MEFSPYFSGQFPAKIWWRKSSGWFFFAWNDFAWMHWGQMNKKIVIHTTNFFYWVHTTNSRVKKSHKKSRLSWFLFIFLSFLQLNSNIQSLLLKLVQFSVIWVVAGLCGPNGSEMRHFWSCLVQKGICLFQISIPCIQLLIKCITRVEIEKTIGGF